MGHVNQAVGLPLCRCCHSIGVLAKVVVCATCGEKCVNADCPGRNDRCVNCGIRTATTDYSGDAMSMIHGFVSRWCEQCLLEKWIREAKESAARLPDLEQRLAKLLADS